MITFSVAASAQKKDSAVLVVNRGAPGPPFYGYINCGCNGKPPVYVIDGVVKDNMNDVNPNDIFKMDVVKSAKDTSGYGPKAKNGVLIITTKAYALKHNIKN